MRRAHPHEFGTYHALGNDASTGGSQHRLVRAGAELRRLLHGYFNARPDLLPWLTLETRIPPRDSCSRGLDGKVDKARQATLKGQCFSGAQNLLMRLMRPCVLKL